MSDFDLIVVGAGHAGCEAASAAARMGRSVALITFSRDHIARLSCNPAIGGLAKGALVRELDALGGHAARHLAASCALRAWRAAAARSLARNARLAVVRAQVSALWTGKPVLRTALGALDGLLAP